MKRDAYLMAEEDVGTVLCRGKGDPLIPAIKGAFDNERSIWSVLHDA